MEPTQARDPALLQHYEGLVIKTSVRYKGIKRYDTDEVRQLLRVKVWEALLAWDPENPKTQRRIQRGLKSEVELRDAWVYGCLANKMKDLLKRDRERELLIEDQLETDSTFERRYLYTEADTEISRASESRPLVPNTLTSNERYVLACMYNGHNGPETAERLGLTRAQVAMAVRSIREKMRDWKPTTPRPSVSPTPAVAA